MDRPKDRIRLKHIDRRSSRITYSNLLSICSQSNKLHSKYIQCGLNKEALNRETINSVLKILTILISLLIYPFDWPVVKSLPYFDHTLSTSETLSELTFDMKTFQTDGRKQIAAANPAVRGDKIQKL